VRDETIPLRGLYLYGVPQWCVANSGAELDCR
jgi:hypothetical protein